MPSARPPCRCICRSPRLGRATGTGLAAAALAMCPVVQVRAQTAAGAAPVSASVERSQPAPSAQVTAGWQDGFVIQSDKGDFRLQIGGLVHADGRFAPGDDDGAVTDTFLIRRLRPYLRGRLAQRFEFFVNPDFAVGTVVLQDAYLDTVFSRAFRLRVGKAKTPFGVERLQSVSNIVFFERGLPTAIAPNRDVGIQVLGDLAGGTVSYAAAVLNGVIDGGSGDADSSDSKDVAARIVVRPFANDTTRSSVRGLALGFAATTGSQSGAAALPTYRTAMLQQPFFTYIGAGAVADGPRTRLSPHVSYVHKSFFGLFEYVRNEMPVTKGSLTEDIAHDSWQIGGSVLLTGESATDGTSAIRPRANFDFGAGHYGAFQIGARYHSLAVDERAFTLGFAAPGSSRKADAWTVGLNWYLNPNFKYVVNFERTVFDDDADGARAAENAIVFRTQVNF